MKNIIKQQFINFLIYCCIGLLYLSYPFANGFTLTGDMGQICIFSLLLFISSTFIIYFGEIVFKKRHILIYLTPQLIGLLFLLFIAIKNNGFNIGYGIDEILWGFLVLSSLLNSIAYFVRSKSIEKMKDDFNSKIVKSKK